MAAQEFPIYNGIAPTWADVSVTANVYGGKLIDMADIYAVKLDPAVDVGEQHRGGRTVRRGSGQGKNTGELTVYRSAYQAFLRQIADIAPVQNGQRIITLVHFDIIVHHTPPGDTEIYQREGRGCRIVGNGLDGQEGVDPDKLTLPLSVVQIVDIVDGNEFVLR